MIDVLSKQAILWEYKLCVIWRMCELSCSYGWIGNWFERQVKEVTILEVNQVLLMTVLVPVTTFVASRVTGKRSLECKFVSNRKWKQLLFSLKSCSRSGVWWAVVLASSVFLLIVLGRSRSESHKMVAEVMLNADNKQRLYIWTLELSVFCRVGDFCCLSISLS